MHRAFYSATISSAPAIFKEMQGAAQLGAQGVVRARWPFCGPDRDDEAGRDEERWPHFRPVRAIVIATDIQAHAEIIGEEMAKLL
jgi:hypothetical protein